ncbi:MAG: hypothetical protein M3378_05830 [Actinomycetota bacterium]|nr:hypothetical protein [Actinomycetota bacterium]
MALGDYLAGKVAEDFADGLPVDVRATGVVVEVAGALTFPFSDFGMDPPNVGGVVTVESDPTLEFRLVLAKES